MGLIMPAAHLLELSASLLLAEKNPRFDDWVLARPELAGSGNRRPSRETIPVRPTWPAPVSTGVYSHRQQGVRQGSPQVRSCLCVQRTFTACEQAQSSTYTGRRETPVRPSLPPTSPCPRRGTRVGFTRETMVGDHGSVLLCRLDFNPFRQWGAQACSSSDEKLAAVPPR